MEQLSNINETARTNLLKDDLLELHWYALFVELCKHLIINAEWNRIKMLGDKDFQDVVAFWSPYWYETECGKYKVNYYYQSYFFVGSKTPLNDDLVTRFKEIPHCLQILTNHTVNRKREIERPSEIEVDQMMNVFNLKSQKKNNFDFKIDQEVKIVNGVLENYKGIIRLIKEKKKRAIIQVNLFKNVMTDTEVSLDSLALV